MEQTDTKLVQATIEGDRSAFVGLYDRHAPLIRAICSNATGNVTDAQDLAQEVFLRAYRKLAELRDPQRFGSWLIGFARRVCREWRRSRARDRHRYVGLDNQPSVAGSDCDEEDGALEDLRRALEKLPEKERLAVHVFYLQQQPAEQARVLLGLSRSGFYRVLERARKRLELTIRHSQEVQP